MASTFNITMSNFCEHCRVIFPSFSQHLDHQTNAPGHYVCDHFGCQQFFFGQVGLTKDQTFAAHYAAAHFHCPIRNCGEVFYNRSDCPGATALQNHYRLKHWELYCPFCDKVFESKDSANTHQLEGHPQCRECHQVFVTQAEKYAHKKALHGETRKTDQQCPRCKYIRAEGFACHCERTRGTEEWYRGSDFEPNCGKSGWKNESNSWGKESNSRSQSHSSEQQQNTTSATADYYSLLGVLSSASHAEILKAAKKARIAAHPDRCSGQNLSPEQLEQVIDHSKAVGQAADILTDAEKRARYDARLRKERKRADRGSQPNPFDPFARPKRADHRSQPNPFDPFAQPKRPRTPKSHGFGENQYDGRKEGWPGTRPQANNSSGFNNPFGEVPNFFGFTPSSAPRPAKKPAPQTSNSARFRHPFDYSNFFKSNNNAFGPGAYPKPASTPLYADPFPNYSGFGSSSQSSTTNSQFNSQTAPNAPFTSPLANGATQAQSSFGHSTFHSGFQTNSNTTSTGGWARADEDVDMTGKAEDNSGWTADDDADMMDI